MECPNCGAYVANDVEFCAKCGAHTRVVDAGYVPAPRPLFVSRVQRHVQALGIWWCIYGVYRLLHAVAAMFFLRIFLMPGFDDGRWPGWFQSDRFGGGDFFHALMPVVITIGVGWALLCLFVGYSLITRRSWGRMLAIVIGILSLIRIPFGTAIGIYTLWVLASGPAGMEYEAIADRS